MCLESLSALILTKVLSLFEHGHKELHAKISHHFYVNHQTFEVYRGSSMSLVQTFYNNWQSLTQLLSGGCILTHVPLFLLVHTSSHPCTAHLFIFERFLPILTHLVKTTVTVQCSFGVWQNWWYWYKGLHRGCGGKDPARFSENCSKVPHWGCRSKVPARVSEHCSVPGYVMLYVLCYVVWLG